MIVDSGLGKYDRKMLVALGARGFYLVAGVTNTTNVTRPTDRNYGPFKTVYQKNRTELTRQRQEQGLTIRPVDIPILVIGDDDKLRNTFNETFGVDINLAIWKLIGISPFTRKCLEDN